MKNRKRFQNSTRTKLLAMIGAALMAGAPAGTAFAQAPTPPAPPAAAPDRGPAAEPGRGEGPRMGEARGRRGEMRRGHRGMGRHHARMMRHMFSPARLAGALAALETGIGITPDQMAVWRRFTGALVAFADASQPAMGRAGPGARADRGDDAAAMEPSGGATSQDDQDADDQADDTGVSDMQAAEDEADAMSNGAGDDAVEAQMNANDQTGDDQASEDAADEETAGMDAAGSLRVFRMLDGMADRAIARGRSAEQLKTAIADLQAALTPQQVETARGLMRSMMREARQEFRMERRMRRGDRAGRPDMHERGPRGDHEGRRGGRDRHGDYRHGHRHGDRHHVDRG